MVNNMLDPPPAPSALSRVAPPGAWTPHLDSTSVSESGDWHDHRADDELPAEEERASDASHGREAPR